MNFEPTGLTLDDYEIEPDFVLWDRDIDSVDETAPAHGFAPLDWHHDAATLVAEVLALHHVPAELSGRILGAVAAVPQQAVRDPLGDLSLGLAATLHFAPLNALHRSRAIALVGPPGAGKTTLAAKLAAQTEDGNPLLINADAAKGGAQEQLSECAEVLGIGLEAALDQDRLTQSLRRRRRRIIIDTSGVNPFCGASVGRLAKLIEIARAEPVLVLPANVEPTEAVKMVAAFEVLPIRRLLVTRLDIVRRLGGLLAAADASGFDLIGGSVTPHFAYGLSPLTPMVVARRLMSAAFNTRRWQTA